MIEKSPVAPPSCLPCPRRDGKLPQDPARPGKPALPIIFIARKHHRWKPLPPSSERPATPEVSIAICAPAAPARSESRVAFSFDPRNTARPFGWRPVHSSQFSQPAKAPRMPALPPSQAVSVAQALAGARQSVTHSANCMRISAARTRSWQLEPTNESTISEKRRETSLSG